MKICPQCEREYGNSSVRCVICKCDLEELGERKTESIRNSRASTQRTSAQNRTSASRSYNYDNRTSSQRTSTQSRANTARNINSNSRTSTQRTTANQRNVDSAIEKEPVQQQRNVSREPEVKGSPSGLSITALVFSILACLSFIGAILAVIDLCIKDGRRKVCSIIALVFAGLWLLIGAIGLSSDSESDRDRRSNSNVETQTYNQSNYEQDTYSSDYSYDDSQSKENQTMPITESKPENSGSYSNGIEFDYGDTHVKYLKHEVVENMAGDKCLAVYYEFTNNSDENQAFMYMYTDKAFQNGVELDGSLFHVEEESKNSSREIQPGTKVTVVSGFVLSDEVSDVTLQVEPWISFSSEKLMELNLSL